MIASPVITPVPLRSSAISSSSKSVIKAEAARAGNTGYHLKTEVWFSNRRPETGEIGFPVQAWETDTAQHWGIHAS